MSQNELLDFLYAILPAAIVGVVAFYFFYTYSQNEERRRMFLMHRENQKIALPIKLQAYERMALFLERISPGKVLFRVKPVSEDYKAYTNLLIATIEQEFEHNLAQQIYVSNECWDYIKTAKNATISLIRKASLKEDVDGIDNLRELILTSLIDKSTPTDAALSYIKKEVKNLV